LTLQNPASIRAAMAAGAIPPPLFFERCLKQAAGALGGAIKSKRSTPKEI
jgi:hypothetical protein